MRHEMGPSGLENDLGIEDGWMAGVDLVFDKSCRGRMRRFASL